MAAAGDEGGRLARLRAPRPAVALLVAFALLVRLAWLDARVAHWDEARVGWWVLQYQETGAWRYYPILHGPFLFHVERWLFGVLGASDAVMRLPTAVVGGLAPATALWFRDHLDDREVVGVAAVLAAAPLLVFYGRFMRSDVVVAVFSLATFGALLRARASGQHRFALAAALSLGLAFTAKENAVLYLLSWTGALGLLVAWRWRSGQGPTPGDLARAVPDWLRRWWAGVVAGGLAWLAVVVWFYAPRTRKPASGLDDVGTDPGLVPDLVVTATVGSAERLIDLWVLGGLGGGSYPLFLGVLVGLLAATAPATVALAAYGTRADRSDRGRARPLVRFCLLWAGLGVVGYPAAVDVVAGWTMVHVVVPLTIPAGVGLAALVERARPLRGGVRPPSRAVLALAVIVAQVAVVGASVNYAAPAATLNPYPQPAQPDGATGPTADAVAAIAADHEGTDVAYVGSYFGSGRLKRLPFPWYVRASGGSSVVVDSPGAIDDPPPVVVAPASAHDAVAPQLEGYVCRAHRLSTWTDRGPGIEGGGRTGPGAPATHVYLDRDAVATFYGSTLSSHRCG